MRYRSSIVRACVAGAALCIGSGFAGRPAPAGAQGTALPTESTGYVVRRGADTVTLEGITRRGDTLRSAIVNVRAGRSRVVLTAVTNAAGLISQMTVDAWPAGALPNGRPAQHATATFRGDSLFGETTAQGQVATSRFAVPAGTLPYFNVSIALLDQIVRRARALGRSPVTVPVLVIGSGAGPIPATLTRVGADSIVFVLGATQLRLAVDRLGRLVGGTVPSQDITIQRTNATVVAGVRGTASDGVGQVAVRPRTGYNSRLRSSKELP